MSDKLKHLVDDIYGMVDKGVDTISDEVIESFVKDVTHAVRRQLENSYREERRTLRMSNLGYRDRKLWYEVNGCDSKEELDAPTRIKFLFGDLVESLILLLVKQAGYEVTSEQKEVNIDGIKGHMDCVINGVPVDVKSASSFSFKKFKEGDLGDDLFGYMEQISAYMTAEETDEGAFLVMDKQLGNLTLMPVDSMDKRDTKTRITHLKEVTTQEEPPERCFEAVPDGKSGNMKLDTGCSYCSFKETCWADSNDGEGLRLFLYSNGPRWLTHVEREPDVFEVTT